MNTEKQPCTNLASLIATHHEMLTPQCTTLLDKYSLPVGWYVTLNKVLADHKRLLNCDGNRPELHVAIINADMGELQLALRPHWNDSLPLETPLPSNVRSRQDLEPDEAEQIEQLLATAPETLTRMHIRYASSALVQKAKEAVRHICEECGAPGERQRDLRKPRVLCPRHYVIDLATQSESHDDEVSDRDLDSWEILFGDVEHFVGPDGRGSAVPTTHPEDGTSPPEHDQNREE